MNGAGFRFAAHAPRLVVYTDLDGTLLDHHDYSWQAAGPALHRLAAMGLPVVPVTSKTVAELWGLRERIGLTGPFAVENGGAIVVPARYFGANEGEPLEQAPAPGYWLQRLGPPYADILEKLRALRSRGYRFLGFADMSDTQVAEHTGLSLTGASLARQRLCSEPLIWQDDETSLEAFREALHAAGLSSRQGGRFLHVMGLCDKGAALQRLQTRFAVAPGGTGGEGGLTLACALGDSPNDFDMLAMAQRAALVQRPGGDYAAPADPPRLIHAGAPGPVGWCLAVNAWLDEYSL
ncbi:MAG: hypothetical protein CMN28_11710 [Salinisphaeraceae bacterium]|nr:hypothetical protein [Salinisphaeraceae bacterium]